jgi:hypothetical protein
MSDLPDYRKRPLANRRRPEIPECACNAGRRLGAPWPTRRVVGSRLLARRHQPARSSVGRPRQNPDSGTDHRQLSSCAGRSQRRQTRDSRSAPVRALRSAKGQGACCSCAPKKRNDRPIESGPNCEVAARPKIPLCASAYGEWALLLGERAISNACGPPVLI